MTKTLVVINPFAGKQLGEPITDPAEILTVLSGENAHDVIAVDQPDPKPAVPPAAADADPKPAKSDKE